MVRAVRFDSHGSAEVLYVDDVERPVPRPDQVVVEVLATSINPGEIMIREGGLAEQSPATFPSGQGSDLAGRVVAVGSEVTDRAVGDEVLGWTDEWAAQAEYVAVPAEQLTEKPAAVSWEQAGSLYVAGGTARGMVDAVVPQAGETVVVAGAAGGVGSIAVQLLRRLGTRVLGIAGPDNEDWLRSVGAVPVRYGDGLVERLRALAPGGVAAVLDAYGGGYVDQAVELGVAPERVVTIIDFAGAERHGARTVFGYQVASRQVLAELAGLIAAGELSVPIAATYPLDDVREAYARLAERHTRGKIVLLPHTA